MEALERRARQCGVSEIFVLTTDTAHWFVEHGFQTASLEELPPLKREAYNHARKSKVLLENAESLANNVACGKRSAPAGAARSGAGVEV